MDPAVCYEPGGLSKINEMIENGSENLSPLTDILDVFDEKNEESDNSTEDSYSDYYSEFYIGQSSFT